MFIVKSQSISNTELFPYNVNWIKDNGFFTLCFCSSKSFCLNINSIQETKCGSDTSQNGLLVKSIITELI
jgi:hypothetical protein